MLPFWGRPWEVLGLLGYEMVRVRETCKRVLMVKHAGGVDEPAVDVGSHGKL